MKKLLPLLALLLALTACSKQEPPPVEPETPPAEVTVQAPAEPETPVEPEPEAEPEAEEPVIEESSLPDLPYPAYCWGDTAVDKNGTVILQVPNHTLELIFDEVSGKPAGFLAQPDQISMILHTAFYALDGQPLLTDTPLAGFRTTGDLYWYFGDGGYTLGRFSDGAVLADGLKTIEPVGDVLVTQSNFWNAPCILVDRVTGETVLELDRGFTLSQVFRDGGNTYLAMESAVDGNVNLIDLQGRPLLDGFHGSIYDVAQGCAVVLDQENDQTIFSAIDLKTGEILFRRGRAFQLLPDAMLASVGEDWKLLDRQGLPLNDTAMGPPTVYDWNADGNPELIFGSVLRDGVYSTIVMQPDGTELATIPTEDYYVTPLSPTKIAYSVFTGEEALHQEARLLDLDKGTDILLTTGSWALVQPIETSGGQMILCEDVDFRQVFLNDGTPAIPDLGTGYYLGGDVFACDEGLRCLDGSWLYRPE